MINELKKLTVLDGIDIYEMLQEMPNDENGYSNWVKDKTFEEFKQWLIRQDEISRAERLEEWMVPSTTYWLYIDGYPVGIGKLRHNLSDRLREQGGHAGYAIRPSERNKGYGTTLLQLILLEAKRINIDRLLLTIRNDNTCSLKVALHNNGIIERINDERHYIWIDC